MNKSINEAKQDNISVTETLSTDCTPDNSPLIPNPKINISRKTSENSTNSTLNEFDKDRLFFGKGITFTAIDWESIFSDSLLDEFVEHGFVVFDKLFSADDLLALQQESGFIDYQNANLTAGERVEHIRGDKTHWIDNSDRAGSNYLSAIESLGQFCNRVFYTGIQHCEAHYACYPVGFGYQWHSDNPKGRDERVLSAVFYLNDDWQQSDGGALEIIDKHEQSHTVLPKANRLILFDSNLLHQVQIAHRQRYSIATWLRRD